jgi:alpha-tubulin suppressor-like RCC1 family protein
VRSPFTEIATGGGYHSCGRSTAGDLYCWGRNNFGQLGDGTNAQQSMPVLVNPSFGFVQTSLGGEHSCARDAAGMAYCWGRNTFGYLGDGTTNDRNAAGPVSSASHC